MGSSKTFDGFRLTDIIKLAESLGAEVRDGKRHQKVITYPGTFPCALGETTGFKQHVMPWVHKAFPAYSNTQIYQTLKGKYT